MDCLTCQEHFSELLEQPETTSAAASHVAECPTCAEAFAAFRQTVRDLRSLPMVAPPAHLPGRIARALDEAPAPRAAGWALWQPLTAGLSMAACLCLLLWAVVLHPVNVSPLPVGSQMAYQAPSATTPAALPSASPSGAPTAATPASRPARAMSRRGYAGPRFVARPPARPGTAARTQPPSFGSWGERLAQLPPMPASSGGPTPAAGDGSGKPAGTFAASDPVTPEAPLHRQPGTVTLAFTPPLDKTVGEAVVGELTVSGQAEAMITLRVTGERGLRVTNAHGGVVYEGPLRKGETLKVPLRLLAWRAGDHQLRAQMESDVPGVAADLKITLAGFVGEMGKNGEAEVSLTFHETPARRAIRQLAAAAGARVVVHGDLEPKAVTLDFSAGVPFAAALRILCDDCGYRIQERDGVYHIVR